MTSRGAVSTGCALGTLGEPRDTLVVGARVRGMPVSRHIEPRQPRKQVVRLRRRASPAWVTASPTAEAPKLSIARGLRPEYRHRGPCERRKVTHLREADLHGEGALLLFAGHGE